MSPRQLIYKPLFLATTIYAFSLSRPRQRLDYCDRSSSSMIPSFETTFAVPLHCDSCVEDVSGALKKLDGVRNIDASLPNQTLRITGTAPPSSIVSAIQSTGRDAILRGSGASNSAAVSILETPIPASPPNSSIPTPSPVRGLARLVQVAPSHTLIDLTLRGLPPGTYAATVRQTGDISRGATSTGAVWGDNGQGRLGEVVVGKEGKGSAFLEAGVEVWEVVGRGLVVERRGEGEKKEEEVVVLGVIARSAGVWDNEKTVCSCSGKTVWEEREEQIERGML